MVRIGIDATALPLQKTGVANYVFGLVRGLGTVDADNGYVVYAKPVHIAEMAVNRPNFRFVPIAFPARGLRLAWEQTGLPRRVREDGLDVLHSPHYTMPLRHPAGAVVTFCDMTFLLHPELHQPIKRAFFPAMMRWSARHADQLITISESTRDDLSRMWDVDPARVTPVPLAAGNEYRPAAPDDVAIVCARHGLQPGGYILYVGVLEPRKNVDRLVAAFGRAVNRLGNLELVIAGKRGWMYDQIFAQVQKLGLEGRVRFTGYVAQEELPALYSGARIFAYPSRYEGFGLPVLEAMRCGVPVVTTNVSSMPEVVGDAALLVSPEDEAALAEALIRLATNVELAASLGGRGRERAALFSWERCARETLQVYERAVADREGRSR
jgi:glycosyltransferase involved in cell wall biosynthesis